MRCTKSGGQLVTVEWIAHLEGGSNWRALNAIRSQDFNPVSSKTKQAYDVWFSTQTLVADGSAPGSIPSRIQFASTLPYDSMSTTVAGPNIPLAGICR